MVPRAKHVEDANPISIQTVARKMFNETRGDLTKATERFVNYVANFPRLSEELLRIGARTLLNSIPITDRKAAAVERGEVSEGFAQTVPFRMNEATRRAQARIRGLGAASRDAILNDLYTIGSRSKPLRDWLGTEVFEHGQRQMQAGKTAVRNAQFLILIGQAAGAARIGDKIDGKAAAELKAKAYELA